MITAEALQNARLCCLKMLQAASIVLTPEEAERIEVADFGLSDLENLGLELITYINTERVCSKDLVLFPGQTCPEHRHPPVGEDPGKEETFRCRQGIVYVYLPGEAPAKITATLPAGRAAYFTVFREYALYPGEQVTIPPDTLHWFQGGPEGAIVSEFSTRSRDEFDVFTDPDIQRATVVAE